MESKSLLTALTGTSLLNATNSYKSESFIFSASISKSISLFIVSPNQKQKSCRYMQL